MPLYEYSCPACGPFEVLQSLAHADDVNHDCVNCGQESGRMASLTTMRPDSLWSGVQTKHGYVTSQAALDRIRLEKGVMTLDGYRDVDAMRKMAREARESQDAKLDRAGQEVFEKSITGTGLVNSFGELRPEANDAWRNDRIHKGNAPIT